MFTMKIMKFAAGHIYLKDNNKYFLFLFAGVFNKL